MAAYKRITLDEAWQLNIMESFNGLSYLKAKRNYEQNEHNKNKRLRQ